MTGGVLDCIFCFVFSVVRRWVYPLGGLSCMLPSGVGCVSIYNWFALLTSLVAVFS